VPKPQNVGRAAVPRRDVPRLKGRAKVGRAVGKVPAPERAHTQVIHGLGQAVPEPVFVDPSGGRRRKLRRVAYLIGFALVIALLLVWLSQLGGGSRPPSNGCSAAPAASCPP
jgi:hypothetical protein